MKIVLISPRVSAEKTYDKTMALPQLSLHVLAALTPEEHEVNIVDEMSGLANLEEDCDLVGISCMTGNVARGYHLADEFRQRGKTVVMGGIHPTLMPKEALTHADCVVIGESEGIWEDLLVDFENGRLQKTYQRPVLELDRYLPVRRKNLSKKRSFNTVPMQTTRGCPYTCDFCTVPMVAGRKMRHRPIEHILKQIEEVGSKKFMILDDNVLGHPKYSEKLFHALRDAGVKWAGQGSIATTSKNPKLLKLAGESGCVGLQCGVETVNKTAMKKFNKSMKSLQVLADQINRVKDAGIHLHASMIFGFDDDTTETFHETLEFLQKNAIGSATFHILTPFPGTVLYENMKKQGRLISTDWADYRRGSVVFQPKSMTVDELYEGYRFAATEFTRFSNVMKRFPKNMGHPLMHLLINLALSRTVSKAHKIA